MAEKLHVPDGRDERTVSLSPSEAYEAMFNFLEKQWELRGKPDDTLPSLLGSAHWPNGYIVDSALWDDWLDAVAKAKDQKRSF